MSASLTLHPTNEEHSQLGMEDRRDLAYVSGVINMHKGRIS